MDFEQLSRRSFIKKTTAFAVGVAATSLMTGLVNAEDENYCSMVTVPLQGVAGMPQPGLGGFKSGQMNKCYFGANESCNKSMVCGKEDMPEQKLDQDGKLVYKSVTITCQANRGAGNAVLCVREEVQSGIV